MRIVIGVVVMVLLYLLAALVLGLIPANGDYEAPIRGTEIWVRSNGVHSDFIVPIRHAQKDWTVDVPPDGIDQAHLARFVAFGWGDRGFFLDTPTWRDLTPGTAFRAVFLPSETTMHVTYWFGAPTDSKNCKKLVVTDEAYAALISYIENSFQRDGAGNTQRIAHPGYDDRDMFYEARGSYHLFRTCNDWINSGLHEMGVRAAVWAPFDVAIHHQLDQL